VSGCTLFDTRARREGWSLNELPAKLVDMATQLFQLERNGKLDGDTCGTPLGPCYEWTKDQERCRVAKLDLLGSVVGYLSPGECREIARPIKGFD
jgi:hypothetical protein